MDKVATVIGYGCMVCTAGIVVLAALCALRDRARRDAWRRERMRAEHYANCDAYARWRRITPVPRSRGPVH